MTLKKTKDNKFTPGDKVKCIYADDYHNILYRNRIYIVKEYLFYGFNIENRIVLAEIGGQWRESRFELFETKKNPLKTDLKSTQSWGKW